MYGNFAGRDASRGMAKQSFDVGTYEEAMLITSVIYKAFLLLRNADSG